MKNPGPEVMIFLVGAVILAALVLPSIIYGHPLWWVP